VKRSKPLTRRAPLARTGWGKRGQPLKRKPAPHIAAGFTLRAKGEDACRVCGAPATDAHHAVPRSLSRRGRDELLNLLPLCRADHRAFHSGVPIPREVFTAAEWRFIEEIAPSVGWLGRRYPSRTWTLADERDAA